MDLNEAWKKLEAERLEKPAAWKAVDHPEKCRSRHPVIRLKKSQETTLVFSVIFLLVFVVLFFLFDPWLVKLFIGIIIGAYVFFTWYNYITYRNLKRQWQKAFEGSLKTALQNIHSIVYKSIRFQEKAALFIYPFSVAAGYMMGLAQHDNFESDIRDSRILLVLLIAAVTMTPVCYYLAKWMYKISYDKYLKQLQSLIDEIDKPE
ncbi:MAG TPA: hypothetical protein PLV21_02135 [Cyclobacteriaceae bacterium]|nr:hypothetical protein [Cyclobacteriaceae bacterium]HRJ80657.1 hypothetical protein [Cyclobacteriaceae bacterium]